MIVQPQVLQECEMSDGNGGFVQLRPGQFMSLAQKTDELVALERAGKLKLHSPFDRAKPDADSEYRIVYTGVEMSLITEIGVFYRGVIGYVNGDGLGYMLNRYRGDITVLDFCEGRPGEPDGMKVVYVPHGAAGTPDFDTDIKAHLPAAPNVLIMRDEGIGDLIMSVPTVREIRRRLPDARITYATKPRNAEILAGVDCIDEVVSIHDTDLSRKSPWHLVVNWCRALEDYAIARNRAHRIDSFATHVGIKLDDRRTEIHPTREQRRTAINLLHENGADGSPLVGYVVQAASWNRTWTPWRIGELVAEFERQLPGVKLVLIDHQRQVGELHKYCPNVINLCGKTASFMEAAAVVGACDALISQDTGLAHAAAAAGTPTLVLCGSIPPGVRWSYYNNFDWIEKSDTVDCCPCWDWQETWSAVERRGHPERGRHKSCSRTANVRCMNAIQPAEIVDRVADLLQVKAGALA